MSEAKHTPGPLNGSVCDACTEPAVAVCEICDHPFCSEHGRRGNERHEQAICVACDKIARGSDGVVDIMATLQQAVKHCAAGGPKPDKRTIGLYGKFMVRRIDGKDAPGQKHHGCQLYVLDIDHDPHAIPALKAYADSCEAEYPLLAADLRRLATETSRNTTCSTHADVSATGPAPLPPYGPEHSGGPE